MSGVEYKTVSVQIEPELLVKFDTKVAQRDLNRSQYIRRLIRADLGMELPENTPAKQPQEVAA